MPEDFEVSDGVENKISQGEKKLQALMTPLLEDEFLEYSDFELALQEYQNNNPDINISKMIEELHDNPTELGNTSLELVVHEFSQGESLENIQRFSNILQERYITAIAKNENINKSEFKEEISEQITDKSEFKEEISEQITDKSEFKEEISEQFIDKNDSFSSTSEVAKKYSLETSEHFEALKNQAQIQLDKFLETDEGKAELETYPNEDKGREELLRKFIILSNTDRLVEAYKNSLDDSLSEEEKELKVAEFKKDIEDQKKAINKESPNLVKFVLNLNNSYSESDIDNAIQQILSKDVNTNLLLYGYSGEKSGNVTTAGIQKVTRNSDGSFDKSLVVNNFELKSNLPKGLDIADYQVSLSKLVKESSNLEEIGNNTFFELQNLKNKLEHLDNSNYFAELDLENINKIELEQEILIQEHKLNQIEEKFKEIQNKILSVVNKFEEQSRLYQLRLKENDEKTRDVLEFISSICMDLVDDSIIKSVLEQLNSNNGLKNALGFNQDFDLENGQLGYDDPMDNALLSMAEKIKFAELFNIMISGEKGKPVNIMNIKSDSGVPVKDKTQFDIILQESGIKDSGTGISIAMKNIEKSLYN